MELCVWGFFYMGYKRVHNKRFVVCSLCLMVFRFLFLWLMLQVYCGLIPGGFDLYLELKILFLVLVILESLPCEDSCSCFWSGFYFLPCCFCCVVVPICELDVGSLTTPEHRHPILLNLNQIFTQSNDLFFLTSCGISLNVGPIVT